jgi:hypothetical protein
LWGASAQQAAPLLYNSSLCVVHYVMITLLHQKLAVLSDWAQQLSKHMPPYGKQQAQQP